MKDEIPNFFKAKKPSFVSRMGIDKLPEGGFCCIDPADFEMPAAKLRSKVGPYAAYHGKKFVTRIKDGKIYVYRTE